MSVRLSFRRAVTRRLALLAVVALGATALSVGVATSASAASPDRTQFAQDTFMDGTVPSGSYLKPNPPSGASNIACLTAGTSTSATPVPGCGLTTPDAAGSGALRLTDATNSKVGGLGSTQSVPISEGLDASFTTYQYSSSNADGIVFYLAATDPLAPEVPTVLGQIGGSLGYSATGGVNAGAPGLARGYLGLGLDVFGNYPSREFEGRGCSNTVSGTQAPNVTVRGPGNDIKGYCVLKTASVTRSAIHGSTRANSGVPVEVVVNPSSAAAMTAGTPGKLTSVSVPAQSYAIVYKPLSGGAQQMLTGSLPRLTDAAYKGIVDPGWFDPATGYPYKLTYGWVASTGGSYDVHEINQFSAQSLTGKVASISSAPTTSTVTPGGTGSVTVTPTVSETGGPASGTIVTTTEFPAGLTPSAPAAGNGYDCTVSGRTVTCSYTTPEPVQPGGSLPPLVVPYTVDAGVHPNATPRTVTSSVSSTETTKTTAQHSVTVVASPSAISATVDGGSSSTVTYGASSATLAASGLASDATGTVTFTAADGSVLCSTTLPATSCATTGTLHAGTYSITASYSGDVDHASATSAPVTLVVTPQPTTLTATVDGLTSQTVTVGDTAATLAAAGVPAGSRGTITFTTADGETLCVATLPDTSCDTPATLGVGSYAVTAAYSGDADHAAGRSDVVTLVVEKKTVTPTATVDGGETASTVFGTPATLAAAGIPSDATGVVSFRDADGTELCATTLPDVSCGTAASLGAGLYEITAFYEGDETHAAASAPVVTLSVTKQPATLTATIDGASSATKTVGGTASTLAVAGLAADATGTVTFSDADGETLCTATLPTASCTTSDALPVGSSAIVARYSGDADHAEATSGLVTLDVVKKTVALTATASPATTVWQDAVTLGTTGLPAGATGTVVFTDAAGTTLCTATLPATSCTTTALLPGTTAITATYSGDATHDAATATTSHEVTPIVIIDTAPRPSASSTALTLTWSGVPSAARYRVLISTSPTFDTTLPGFGGTDGGRDVGLVESYSIDGLDPATTYYYRVLAETVDGVVLESQDAQAVTAAVVPPAAVPSAGSGAAAGPTAGVSPAAVATAAASGSLAFTGSDGSALGVMLAALLMIAGLVTVAVARVRRGSRRH